MRDRGVSIHIAPLTYIVFAFCIVLLPFRWIAAWVISVTIHEFGHLVACRLCGARKYDIKILPHGMKISTEGLSNKKQLISSLAGPFAGLVILLFAKFAPLIAMFSSILSVFNLLPIANSDGYHALQCLLFLFISPKKADGVSRIADIVSRVLLCCVVLYISWILCWPAGIIFCGLLMLRIKRNPCKEATIQVQ